MRVEPFGPRESSNCFLSLLQRARTVLDNAGSALELIDSQTAERSSSAPGWQHMTRASHVVAQNGGGIRAQKNRAGGDDPFRNFRRLSRHDLAMFRGKLVRKRNRIIH